MNFSRNSKFDEIWPQLGNYVDRRIHPDTDDVLNYAAKIRIAQVRIFYGVPKTTLAKMIGTSYRQYLRYEEGGSVLPVYVLSSLAYFYNLSIDFLAGLKDEPQRLYQGDPVNVNGYVLTDCWQTAEPQAASEVRHFAPSVPFPCFFEPYLKG